MYISICGNTGAGKSTLGAFLANALGSLFPVSYVDEKLFHHSLLQKMFDCPCEYAFLMQMNFLLQRVLKIKYLEKSGAVFVMERSLCEDAIFAFRHHELGEISDSEFAVYTAFLHACQAMVPAPLGYVYLSCEDPAILTNRVIQGYKARKRNKELPDDKLYEFVDDLNARYNTWFEGLDAKKLRMPILTCEPSSSQESIEIVRFCERLLHEKL